MFGAIAWQEFLFADHVEIAHEQLAANGALPIAAAGLDQLHARFDAFVEKAGTDFASVLQLVMPIIGKASAQLDLA